MDRITITLTVERPDPGDLQLDVGTAARSKFQAPGGVNAAARP